MYHNEGRVNPNIIIINIKKDNNANCFKLLFIKKLKIIADINIGKAIKNCWRVKLPAIIIRIAKNKYLNLIPFSIINSEIKIVNEKRRFVNGSGNMPVDEKTSIGINATSAVREYCK